MSLGPVMLDLQGTTLLPEERELLRHPLVGGLILFTRNYESPEQLSALLREVHALREPRLLVAVDHEGGRVQRFRNGFSALPPARVFGDIHAHDPRRARRLAEATGWVMASELRAVGVDFSFAPVLDVDRGVSRVIGDRSFHHTPDVVAELAHSYMLGMRKAGMAATGKHFPGHGAVEADSHLALPVDQRRYEDIYAEDIVPFERMIGYGLAGIMPAHVVYAQVDAQPAGFSRYWLGEVLRRRLGFQGVIFSDDLSMEGAACGGDYAARAAAAVDAGCDMVLVCNNRAGAEAVLDGFKPRHDPVLHTRLARMHGRHPVSWESLHRDPHWQQAVQAVERLAQDPTMEFAF